MIAMVGLIYSLMDGVRAARLDRGVAIGRTKATLGCGVFRSVSSFGFPLSVGVRCCLGTGSLDSLGCSTRDTSGLSSVLKGEGLKDE